MKPEVFEASIKKDTDQLYLTNGRKVVCKNGAFISIGSNKVYYQAENSESINIKRKFEGSEKKIKIRGDFSFRITPGDSLSIDFEEFQAFEVSNIQQKHNFKYSFGDKLYAQGGVASSSKENLTGEYTEFTVTKVDENGKVVEMSISAPGKYISPPSNPVQIMDQEGKSISADIEFDQSDTQSILERNVLNLEVVNGYTEINLLYPLPKKVHEGNVYLSKQVIRLNKNYGSDSVQNTPCEMTFDFSPVAKIPILPHDSINPHAMYNEGIKMIEQKFLQLEKRISDLENRNY
tara:strand:+ start:1416 stop:2288 length:873 start_codon:yes stop_codon:yes gene_type:complete